jgi:hypothetical protein
MIEEHIDHLGDGAVLPNGGVGIMDERSEWISKRAYSLWEKAGRPWGCDQEHWNQAAAERDIMERTRASCDGQELLLKIRQKTSVPYPEQARQEGGRNERIRTRRIR